MSIESAQMRMNQVAAMYSSVIQKPTSVFGSVLNEKLNTTQNVSQTQTSATQDTNMQNNTDYISQLQNMLNQTNTGTDFCVKCGISANDASHNTTQNTPINGSISSSAYPNGIGVSQEILDKAAPYMDIINRVSAEQGMPANLIMGIIKAESNFNNNCVSYAGAKGLMQLMPETAAEVGVTDEFDPAQNIEGSVKYINKLIDRYDGDVKLALAAYNTGPGKIARRGVTSSDSPEYLTVPQSIRDYADRVLRYAGYQE